jgi:uncharacterized protein YggU (UPF0235/DUF167 family)
MIRVSVRVHPGASRERVCADQAGGLEVWVRARAVENRANEALLGVLAERLGVSRGTIRLVHGQHGKLKLVELPLSSEELSLRLSPGG